MSDPTRTLTIRRRATAKVNRKFNRVKLAVLKWIKNSSNLITTNNRDFEFVRDAQKITEFNEFLQQQINDEILFIEFGGEVSNHWLNIEIGAGYDRGARKARLAGERSLTGLDKIPNYSPLANPKHAERAELIYTRAFDDLTGVTETMSKQMSQVLGNALLQGRGVEETARLLVDRVDKIGLNRARLIARTEIVESHNMASVTEAEIMADLTGEETKVIWLTNLDGRERPTHHERHNKIFGTDEVKPLLGEPNCRCSVSLYVDISDL